MACFDPRIPSQNRGCIGQIRLAPSRKLDVLVMHEAIHAAFQVSRYNAVWPVWEQASGGREEFICQVADYIFENIMGRIRKKNYYRV